MQLRIGTLGIPCSMLRIAFTRHCEEPLRRSNPDFLGEELDCFALLAMTGPQDQTSVSQVDLPPVVTWSGQIEIGADER